MKVERRKPPSVRPKHCDGNAMIRGSILLSVILTCTGQAHNLQGPWNSCFQ